MPVNFEIQSVKSVQSILRAKPHETIIILDNAIYCILRESVLHIEMFKKYNIEYDTELLRAPKIFHQITGAYFVKYELHINDPDIFGAIRYHATGHKNMTLFEKIIYIADFIEPERDFADVDTCRSLAFKDLDKACFAYIKFCIEKNVKKGSYIYKDTFEFYNSLTEVV